MKVSLKRCIYFITCDGKYKGGSLLDSPELRQVLTSGENRISIFHLLTADKMTSETASSYILKR